MIEIDFQTDPDVFLRSTGEFLMAAEAEHNLLLSLCEAAARKMRAGQPSGMRFFTLSHDGVFCVSAARTPPHNLVLCKSPGGDLAPLVEKLAADEADIPGIVGPAGVAAGFAELWMKVTRDSCTDARDQIMYALSTVHMLPLPGGAFRPARAEDTELLAGWVSTFTRETLPESEHVGRAEAMGKTQEFIASGRIFVWEAGGAPVSMAGVSGTERIARVNLVYTPEEERGKGYASAVVSTLSQKQLEAGKKACCLYADARNPVSNSIYRKIGYEFAGRSSHYVLARA